MTVSAEDKNEMAKLIALMNQGIVLEDAPAPPAIDPSTYFAEGVIPDYDAPDLMESGFDGVAPAIAPPVQGLMASSDPSVAAMKNILMAFHGIESPVQALSERAGRDRELREALVTETTTRGLRMGSWEIVINESTSGLKFYDVTNTATGEPIAEALTVYDAALGITRHLNEGRAINSREIREILNAEAAYEASRSDAKVFRTRMESSLRAGNDTRAAIMEDRYGEALDKAKQARVRLSKMSKL